MADELLVTLTGLLGAAILTTATLVGGYLLRRVHELRDRIRDLEARLDKFRAFEKAFDKASDSAFTEFGQAFRSARRRNRGN